MRGYLFGMTILVSLALSGLTGCGGPTITPPSGPVKVTLKVTSGGKPVNNVTVTLQPIVSGGRQADIPISNGEGSSEVTPGTYTYFVEKGKSEADIGKIPAPFRQGSMDRKIEITQAGTHELQLN